MKNVHEWQSTKYIFRKGKLIASRNPSDVGVTSRLYADLTAAFYDRFIPQYTKGHLADLGCGNVPLYHAYKNYISEVTCVDWANSLHENKYLDVVCDLNKSLPFEENHFDTIIISDVLEHIAQPEIIWAEMSRILKPGGAVLVSVPFFYRIHEAPYDYYRYTEFALRAFAKKNNMEVVELHALGGLPEVLTDLTSKSIAKLPVIGRPIARILQRLCYTFTKTGAGKKVSVNSGKIYPLGYFLIAKKL